MKAVVALLVFLMSASAIAGGAVVEGEFDPMSGIPLQDEFTERFLPASSVGDIPALKAILEERNKTLTEVGETAMLLYQIGMVHWWIGNEVEVGEEILHHADEARKALERAIKLGLEARYLPFAHAFITYSIGTRAVHVGILESLFALEAFDRHNTTAIRLGKEFYGPDPALSLMHAVRGRRLRDTPWFVGGSSRRAMEYFRKAVELDPGYISNYLDIAKTYEMMKENNKAIEYYQKVIELPLQERYRSWGMGNKESAKEALERLKAR